MKPLRRIVWLVVVPVAAVALVVVTVFPTRTLFAQRASIARAESNLGVLAEQNEALEERADVLRDDAEIERLAREQYNLVRPGEEAYAILPPPAPPTTVPAPDEAELAEPDPDRNFFQRIWHSLFG